MGPLTVGLEKGCYNEQIQQLEEEQTVSYITSAERIGMKKGYEQGIQQGIQQGSRQTEHDVLIRLLNLNFFTCQPNIKNKLIKLIKLV